MNHVNDATSSQADKAPGDCSETLQELQLFLDGELPDGQRSHVLAHIEACLECYQAFDFHAELKQIIATKCHNDEMPGDLMSRIQQCLDEDLRPGSDDEPTA